MFKEIKSDIYLDLIKLFDENDIDKLELFYDKRQIEWEKDNNKVITDFLDFLYPKWRDKIHGEPSSITLNNFIALCKRSNNLKINSLLESTLKNFNYNDRSELIQIILLLDLYLSHKIDFYRLQYFLRGI